MPLYEHVCATRRTMYKVAVITDTATVQPRQQQATPSDFDLCSHTAGRVCCY